MDILDFLEKTDDFAGFNFVGLHDDFDIEFIRECYKKYNETGINYLQIANTVYLASWDNYSEYLLSDSIIEVIEKAMNDEFIVDNLSDDVIKKCKNVLNRTLKFYELESQYLNRRKKANTFLSNKNNRKKIFNKLGRYCAFCGDTKNLCIDHIISVHNGGSNELNNLQVLCVSCNSKKGYK